jgi:hypothetical protein
MTGECRGKEKDEDFSFGFRERLRQTYIKNGFDLNSDNADDWNFVRVRTQLWGKWRYRKGWEIHAGINNEHRHWFKSTRGYENRDFEINELVLENLYISADRIAGSPVSVKLGRQNIRYGEGFLMMDASPLDGSRTIYFNGIRVKTEMDGRVLEFHSVANPEWDRYLPVVNSLRRNLVERDERGAGIYYVDDALFDGRLESYYFFKSEDTPGDNRDEIHTMGGRVRGEYGEGGIYAAELAFQFGNRAGEKRRAVGGYAHSDYRLMLFMRPVLGAGMIYLSGDDPETAAFEGWNPLYSRWPKWSDLYIYTLASLGRGVAYWENLAAINLKLSLSPSENTAIDATVYYMTAPEAPLVDSSDPAPAVIGGSDRGILSILKFSWSYTEYLSGHLLWERFYPGNYYFDGADPADFLRCQFYFNY